MAENESMEGKDLAQEEKKEEENRLLEAIQNLKVGQTTVSIEGLEITNYGGLYTLKMRGITFGTFDEKGKPTYIRENLVKLREVLAEEGIELESLDLPDLEQAIDQEEQEQKQEEQEEENEGEEQEGEKDDEKPELEDDKEETVDEEKEKLAKEYGVTSSQVIHIAKNKKITKENFGQIADWSRNYDDVYVIPGEDEYSRKFIGVKDGKQEEIKGAQRAIGGKNPDILVKRIDRDKITEIRPLSVYELDDRTAIAIVKDQYGKPEALYCRQEGGNKKVFWGSVIPEASGKNVRQQGPETRDFMDYRSNSGTDLSAKADALSRQKGLEERGMPSKKEGVQVDEIKGSVQQNRELNIDDIVKDLMSRDGIMDKATVPPGYYESKAQKVLDRMEADENIQYEDAVEKVNEEGQREKGGRTPGEPRDKRGE